MRVPQQIKDKNNVYNFKEAEKGLITYSTRQDGLYVGFCAFPKQIETEFEIVDRPTPKKPIVKQGKYECGPACLAMLINQPLFYVKRAMSRYGWNNDSYGCTTEQLILAAREFGVDLLPIRTKHLKPGIGPCELSVPSLNYKGRTHAVVWDGEEILDPNYGYEGRKVYSTLWSPWTIDATHAILKLKNNLTDEQRFTLDKLAKRKKWTDLLKWSDGLITEYGGVENL